MLNILLQIEIDLRIRHIHIRHNEFQLHYYCWRNISKQLLLNHKFEITKFLLFNRVLHPVTLTMGGSCHVYFPGITCRNICNRLGWNEIYISMESYFVIFLLPSVTFFESIFWNLLWQSRSIHSNNNACNAMWHCCRWQLVEFRVIVIICRAGLVIWKVLGWAYCWEAVCTFKSENRAIWCLFRPDLCLDYVPSIICKHRIPTNLQQCWILERRQARYKTKCWTFVSTRILIKGLVNSCSCHLIDPLYCSDLLHT